MRRPSVYEHSAPRAKRPRPPQPVSASIVAADAISRALPMLIADAREHGHSRLADALEVARVEAEIAAGRQTVGTVR